MAFVRRRAGTKNFFMGFKIPTGETDAKGKPVFRWVHRSSGTDDRSKALQMAISYERAAVLAGEKKWSENAAKRFLAEISVITGTEIAHVESTETFLLRWFNGRKSSWRGGTAMRYEAILRSYIAFLGDRRAMPLSDNTPAIVARFRDAEVASGKTAATVNKSLMVLAAAFEEAKTLNAVSANPARGLNVKGAKKNAQKRSAFSFEQFRRLVRALRDDEEWQTLILTLGYTGARQQEGAKLLCEQIDIERERMTLNRSKTADEHWLPLHPYLKMHYTELLSRRGNWNGPLLPALHKMQRRAISNNFRRAILPKIGITQDYKSEGDKGRKLAAYSLHSLRHSLSTWLAAADVPEDIRMSLIGHEDHDINRGYTHRELEQASGWLAKVPSVG